MKIHGNMKTMLTTICLSVITVLASACGILSGHQGKIPGYNLKVPDKTIILPEVLHEISGMTLIDNSSFACIEDNDGIVFIYDFVKKEIKRQFVFWSKGDFEGITRVNDKIYALRSDGFLFEITNFNSGNPDVTPYPLGIPQGDNEGVCYDKINNRLLITCKEIQGKNQKLKNKRLIYGFDLKTKTVSEKPVYSFDLKDFRKFADDNGLILNLQSDNKKRKEVKTFRFHPSDIAIHPFTGEIYILSAVDKTLAVFDISGNIRHLVMLTPSLFNQPEGIIFLDNGEMLISNEGGSGRPTLLLFDYRK